MAQGRFFTWEDLAVHDARIRREAEVKALRDAADQLTTRIPDVLGYKVQAVFTEDLLNRADQIERGCL